MSNRPVFFLASANDRKEGAQYLRNLPDEIREIKAALYEAKLQGLCDYEYLANATLTEILDIFTRSEYRNRIAVFHYAGHANDFQLMLETKDGGVATADAAGLAAFLSQQFGMQLVFLNGCSTQRQVEALLDANIPMVIATSQAIKDDVARKFASQFYQGLARGINVRAAYKKAEAAVRAEGDGNVRNLFWAGAQPALDQIKEDRWPWNLNFKKGAETAGEWNLPEAAENPLFGLPCVPPGDLPAEPFRHLSWFTRKEAEVFFGRNYEIRQLYDRITEPSGAPIVLLYGQTGVGKSSLLDAGITPRLENSHHVVYSRRNQQLGLLGTAALSLGSSKDSSFDLGSAWLSLEEQSAKKPLLLILDQIEEVFTRPSGNPEVELEDFVRTLVETFAIRAHRPQGRLILGFRKEWESEIEQKLNEHNLPHSKVFLDPLDRRDIIQAITGLTKSERLQRHYGLTISEELPEVIADDLSADLNSPIAPTLQILLTKLWAEAKKRNNSRPAFNKELYSELQRQGILLSDFLDQQLSELQKSQPQIVESGLALDVLAYHTTPLGTAEQRTETEIIHEYNHRREVLPQLLEKLKGLYLLADPPQDVTDPTNATRLAHDTLGPLIRAKFSHSVYPGQRSRRILENRNVEWKDNATGSPLDIRDLSSVEAGLLGMRALLPEEERLIQASRKARDTKKFKTNVLRVAGLVAVLAIVVSAGVMWWLSRKAEAAREQALARQLVAQANSLDNGPARFLTERVLLGIEAAQRFESPETVAALREPLALLPRLIASRTDLDTRVEKSATNTSPETESRRIRIEFSPDYRILAIADANTITLWDSASNTEVARMESEERINSIRFSRDGRYMAYGSGLLSRVRSEETGKMETRSTKGVVVVWNCVERRQVARQEFPTLVRQLGFLQDQPLVTMADLWTAKTMSLDGKDQKADWQIAEHDIRKITRSTLSQDGRYLAVGTWPVVKIYDVMSGRDVSSVRVDTSLKVNTDDTPRPFVSELTFSPDGTLLLTYAAGLARVWDWRTAREVSRRSDTDFGRMTHITMSPDNKYVAAFQGFAELTIWKVANGKTIIEPFESSEFVEGTFFPKLLFSPDSRFLVVSSGDLTARVFHMPMIPAAEDEESAVDPEDGSRVKLIESLRITPGAMITDVTYRPDGNCLATADQNGQTAIWSLQGLFDESTMPGVESIYYDPKAQYEVRRDKSGLSVFRLSDNNQIVRFEGATNSIVFSNDGSRLAFEKRIDENKDVVNVIELSSGKVLRETAAFGNSAFALSADGSRLLFWEDGKALKELEIASGGVVKEHPDVVGSDRSRISSDGRYFATSVAVADSETEEVTSFSPIVIFDTENDQKVATIGAKGPQFSIVFSPGSDYVGATLDDTNVVIWDLKHLREHRRISAPAAISQLIFSNDSKYLAGTMGASVIVWDVMTTKPSILPHRSGTMNNVAFGKDSSWIVTTHEMELQSGAQLEVWRLPGGELTSTLQINTGISRAFFAPGDQKLALIREYLYNYDNPFSRLVFWKKDDLIQEACKRVGRNLTQEEWKQYLGTEPYHQTCENLPPGP